MSLSVHARRMIFTILAALTLAGGVAASHAGVSHPGAMSHNSPPASCPAMSHNTCR